MDISLGDYDEKAVINTEMAIFKWTNRQYMTDEEYNALPEDKKPQVLVPPKMPPLDKSERIFVKKEDLKVQEIQAL